MKQLIFKTSDVFKTAADERGSLQAFNSLEAFPVKRIFLITCKKGNWRGKHYHKKTTQVILVLSGEIEVKIKDMSSGTLQVGTMNAGCMHTHLPLTQFDFCATSESASILVLCDTEYDQADYYMEDL